MGSRLPFTCLDWSPHSHAKHTTLPSSHVNAFRDLTSCLPSCSSHHQPNSCRAAATGPSCNPDNEKHIWIWWVPHPQRENIDQRCECPQLPDAPVSFSLSTRVLKVKFCYIYYVSWKWPWEKEGIPCWESICFAE